MISINRNSVIMGDLAWKGVSYAVSALRRDMQKCFLETPAQGASILVIQGKREEEGFALYVEEGRLVIEAGGELGFIYGIYEVSRRFLGVKPFWFWNDQKMEKVKQCDIPSGFSYESKPFAVKYRGWFVNDEVLIHAWKVNRREEEPWEMVFEALLRSGGNLVIPGTDANAAKYRGLASSMGLILTHHHAEPLGAEMFARAYPGVNPSYDEYPELFERLWREGIIAQKGKKVIWNLGFRGQGDRPFWLDDPKYDTGESRGALISRLIKKQYDMVKELEPKAVCCTNLYGEVMELYQEGHLKLPEDVIKIWADNGFGKMVTRRRENHNPRIPSLPDKTGRQGIYYHVSFYDLQAANHMTMLPNPPEFVKQELQQVLDQGGKDYWIINCSNVKPHVYYLDFIAHIWKNGNIDIEEHQKDYIKQYYPQEGRDEVLQCLKAYWEAAPAYGEWEDEHAGEQFSNHTTRMLISQYMKEKNEPSEYLFYACNARTLEEQVRWYQAICKKAVKSYGEYVALCREAAVPMVKNGTESLFCDSFLLQAKIHYYCYLGAWEACQAVLYGFGEEYAKSFYHAGKGKKYYEAANAAMREREHGKWKGFYANDCFTDMKQTAWLLGVFMGYVRNLGDGPHFYQWQREFLYSEEDKRVMLLLNLENHLQDEEMFDLMEERWGD